MNPLADFYIAFTTQGLVELQKGLDDIDKKLDGLDKGFGSASKGSDNLLGSLGSLFGKLTAIGGVALTAGAAIKNAFDVGDRTLALKNAADASGVAAQNIEALGIALNKYGGNTSTAGATFKKITDLLTEFSQGKISESQQEIMSRFGFSIRASMTPEQVLSTLHNAMYDRVRAGDYGGRNQIAAAFGLDQSVMLFLSQDIRKINEELQRANGLLVLSNDETQKNAAALADAKQELKLTWDKLSAELIPIITEVIKILTPMLGYLAVIAQKAMKEMGSIWNAGKDIFKAIMGEITWDEAQDRLEQSDSVVVQKSIEWGKSLGEYLYKNKKALAENTTESGALDIMAFAGNELETVDSPWINTVSTTANTTNDNRTYNSAPVSVSIKVPGQREYEAGTIGPDGTFTPNPGVLMSGVR